MFEDTIINPMDEEEIVIPADYSQYDNHEFSLNEIFTGDYPPQAALWCNENGYLLVKLEPDEEGNTRWQIQEAPEPTEEEIAEYNAMLNLTAADVERGIYKAKGMDFDDVITLVEQYNEVAPLDAEGNPTGVDIKALKIELKANNFYRGSEWVNKIGSLLGFTSTQLDLFFKDGDYTHLLSE